MEKLLNARQLAEGLGISPHTVLDWFEAGLMPGFKLNGRSVRFREDEVEAWLETQRSAPRNPAAVTPIALELVRGGV